MSSAAGTLPNAPNPAAARRSSEIARWVASATLALFLLATMAVPAAFANKILYIGLFGLILVAPVAARGRVRVRSFSPLIAFTIFAYGYVLSFLFETDRVLANQLMLSVALLLLIYLIDWYAIDFDRLIKFSGVFLCVFSVATIFALVFFANSAANVYLREYFLEYSMGAIGQRSSFTDNPLFTFRIGTAQFLFLPYCLFFSSFLRTRRILDVLALLLIGFVIVLSTSRGLILGCLLATGYLVLTRLRPSGQVIGFCVGAFAAILAFDYLLSQTAIFSATEYSNRVKIGHIVSFFEYMTPWRMLFGEGLAAFYFTSGFNLSAAQTEITLLDMVRYLGAPLTGVLYAALLFPSLRRESYGGEEKSTSVFIFVVYLAISLSNPVLFNSYGLLIVVWYWSIILGTSSNVAETPSRNRAT
jgi:hypothetical protein